jgi:nucleoside-diphosphate-sugar epimerase
LNALCEWKEITGDTIVEGEGESSERIRCGLWLDRKVMNNNRRVACVTGGSGIVGQRIVRRLIIDGYRVRVLSRHRYFDAADVELFTGSLDDVDSLREFVIGAHLLFHCAAELYDESKMWKVNVIGTERLLNVVKGSNIQYLCHLSSAGVVGQTDQKWVDEKTKCNPQNAYERSKWAAEELVLRGIERCRIVVLRPINVVDENRPGALSLPMTGSWLSRLKVFLKGGECAHIVHAEDVADAALFFVSHPIDRPQCFFVSCDNEPLNTFAGLWSLYKAIENDRAIDSVTPVPHLPLLVPHILRKLWRGRSNRGDVRYTSNKLISEGFKFHLGVEGAVKRLISKNCDK